MEDKDNGFENDPQDSAELSSDMADAEIQQENYEAKSVYDGLVRIGSCRGKLYGTGGRRANMLRFDLTSRCVFAGNCCLMRRGELLKRVLETNYVKVTLPEGIPWLAGEEKSLDPERLYDQHYLSRPNGSEKFMHCNFPAKDVDEMTDDELTAGIPRDEARIRLEAWMLCAAMDGTMERYVTGKPNWRPEDLWWSAHSGEKEHELVIRTDWWRDTWSSKWHRHPGSNAIRDENGLVCVMADNAGGELTRTVESAEALRQALTSLSDAVFRMQVRVKQYDCDPVLNEANQLLRYIDRG